MTREEAIEVIRDIYNYTKWDTYTTNEARTMAIKALEQEPCEVEATESQKAYNKGFEDCRQATIEAFQMFRGYEANRTNAEWVDRIETVVKKLPPVNPQPKTGHWIITCKSNITGFSIKTCSICNTQALEISKYCPDCGCRMVEPQERSDKE